MSSSLLRQSLEFIEKYPSSGKEIKSQRKTSPRAEKLRQSQSHRFKSDKKKIYGKAASIDKEKAVSEYLHKLNRVTFDSLEDSVAEKLLERARSGRALSSAEKVPTEEPSQGTVFTEEDFRKFEEEYFCH